MAQKVNGPCHCGSGKKYKKCCMRRDTRGFDERDLIDPGPVPQHVKDATDRMMVEEGWTHDKAQQLLAITQQRVRDSIVRPMKRVQVASLMAMLEGFTGEHGPSIWG